MRNGPVRIDLKVYGVKNRSVIVLQVIDRKKNIRKIAINRLKKKDREYNNIDESYLLKKIRKLQEQVKYLTSGESSKEIRKAGSSPKKARTGDSRAKPERKEEKNNLPRKIIML